MDRAPNPLRLRLLGGFELRADDGRDAAPANRKTRALLACLALTPGNRWPREKLMALLWSERSEEQARASLRQALAELRRALGEPSPLRTENDAVSLDPARLSIDAIKFERLAKGGELAAAAALYRGDLLDGHGVRDGAFDDWLLVERRRLHDLAVDLLSRFAASQSGDPAIETALRLLRIEPEREETHRLLMRLYAAAGRRPLALRQYELGRETLQRELGIAPDAETEELHRQIQNAVAAPRAIAAVAEPASSAKSRPSIAVLPFTNMSTDPEQEYFADGMAEEIIATLSRLPWLLVIARNSSFALKGKAADIKQVARALGVRYILEGSVRKGGGRLRITGQLIDASSGAHLWADHFDGTLDDVFDLQDRVTASVVGAIEPRLRTAEIERAWRKPTESLDAYDLYLRALALSYYNRDENRQAVQILRRVIELDPRYAKAYGLAGLCILWQKGYGWISPTHPAIGEGLQMARTAADEAGNDPEALWMAGGVLGLLGGDLKGGLALIERSLSLNPNSANACTYGSHLHAYLGDCDMAVALGERSMRLSPHDPLANHNMVALGLAHFMVGHYEEAAAWCDRAIQMRSNLSPAFRMKAASFGLLGKVAEGHEAVERLLALNPDETLTSLKVYYKVPMKKPGCLEAFLDGLRKAGLPE